MLRTLEDIFGGLLLTIFALGWLDLGQGSQYTWWGLIHYLGNLLWKVLIKKHAIEFVSQ